MKKLTSILVLICFVTAVMPTNLMALTCGADLNNDGFTDAQNETATCINYPVHNGQGNADYCSVQAVNCESETPTKPIKMCLDQGYNYVVATDRCEKAPVCPTGTNWDAQAKACITDPLCSASMTTSFASSGFMGWKYYPTPCSAPPGGSCQVMRIDGSTGQPLYGHMAQFDVSCNWVSTIFNTYSGGSITQSTPQVDSRYHPLVPGGQYTDPYGYWSFLNTSPPGGSSGTESPPDCGPGQFDSVTGVCTAPYTLSRDCVIGTYNPVTGLCESDVFNCPLGNFTCFDTGGSLPQCSPNPCVDTQAIQNEVILPPPDDSWLQNDGQVDANGNCLGALYIFSGKSARCRPPGYEVGQLNDCCESSDTITDSKTGSKYSSYVSALKTTYQMAKTAYYSYQIGTGAMTATTSATGAVTVTSTATGATVTTAAAGSQVGTGVMAAQGAASSGAGAAGATGAGLQGFTSALLNPATIAIAIVVMVAMKILFGNGCDENDVQAAIFNESGYCHYLGDICVKEFDVLGCVQRAKRFCCFNSKMARIVAEQGRPQLKAFGPSGGWGTAEDPNCRGFTPEEFQQLDFSKIDLTEYFGDIMDGMNQNVQDAQQRIQQGIQNHYQGTQ